jgi:hypothetical protein
MFANSAVHLIDGINIDQPRNPITLTTTLHSLFDKFQLFFELPEPSGRNQLLPSHEYSILQMLG